MNKLKEAEKIWGVTEDCISSSYILPNGKILDLRSKYDNYEQEHAVIHEIYPQCSQYESPIEFMFDAPTILSYNYYHPQRDSFGIAVGLGTKLTDEQWEKLEECVCFYHPEKEKVISVDIYNEKKRRERSGSFDVDNADRCFQVIDNIKKRKKQEENESNI